MPFDESERQIFKKVWERVKKRKDSLRPLEQWRGRGLGIEGWLKVETLNALNVKKVQNVGVDLIVEEKGETKKVELKAQTGFGLGKWLTDAACKADVDICLYLQSRSKLMNSRIRKLKCAGFDIDCREINSHWILMLIKCKKK